MFRKATGTAKLYRTKIGVKIACLLALLTGPLVAESVTIYRDGWGVPHVYGDTDRAAAFGYGYAMAEDRLESMVRNYRLAIGRLAEAEGASAVSSDFRQRLWRHHETAVASLSKMSPPARAWVDAFTAGVRHYADGRDTFASGLEPSHVLAFTRYAYWQAVVDALDREHAAGTGDRGRRDQGALWALAAERSTEDAVTVVADPDAPWTPGRHWYEAHVHGRTIHAWGFAFPGAPLPAFGHNRSAGWGWLPGGADTGDVYRIAFASTASNVYTWGGRRHVATLDSMRIAVKGKADRVLVGLTTHLGPIMHREGTIGYAFRVPRQLEEGHVDQLLAMLRAGGFRAFYDAIRPGRLGPATFLFGDTSGVLFYIRSGPVPIRPESVDWDRPVATDAGSDWLGTHIQEDLLQIVDPRPGWILDADTSPDRLTDYSPLTPDRYPRYLFGASPGTESDRSTRLRRLLTATSRHTLDELFTILFDTHVVGSEDWLRALRVSVARLEPTLTDTEQAALDILSGWDGRAKPDRLGPALYRDWRSACEGTDGIDIAGVESLGEISDDTARTLVGAFRKSVAAHVKTYGHADVRWREAHRMRRGERTWGLPGSGNASGVTARRVRTRREGVVDYGTGGQSAPAVMVFDPRGVRSWSAVPFGQSDNPETPHGWDQAEALFTRDRLKPTRFDRRPPDLKKQQVIRLTDDLLRLD